MARVHHHFGVHLIRVVRAKFFDVLHLHEGGCTAPLSLSARRLDDTAGGGSISGNLSGRRHRDYSGARAFVTEPLNYNHHCSSTSEVIHRLQPRRIETRRYVVEKIERMPEEEKQIAVGVVWPIYLVGAK